MTARQQWGLVLAMIILLAGGAFTATHFLTDELTAITVGTDAPAFTARTLDAVPRTITLADFRGEVVLLNIWATWCGPCRVEMPSMQSVYAALGPQGLKVVAVSIDEAGKEQEIRDFAHTFGLTFPLLHDASGTIQDIYRTAGVPETVVLARDGTIRKKWTGADDWNSAGNRALFTQLLAEPRP